MQDRPHGAFCLAPSNDGTVRRVSNIRLIPNGCQLRGNAQTDNENTESRLFVALWDPMQPFPSAKLLSEGFAVAQAVACSVSGSLSWLGAVAAQRVRHFRAARLSRAEKSLRDALHSAGKSAGLV